MSKTKNKSVSVCSCDLGCRLYAARVALAEITGTELSYASLMLMTGVDASRILTIESAGGADVRSLAALAFALHVTTDWLLGLAPLSDAVKVHEWPTNRLAQMRDASKVEWHASSKLVSGAGARKYRSLIKAQLPEYMQ